MCCIFHFKPKKIEAKKDIHVFKIVQTNLKSMCFNFPYKVGKTYQLEKKICLERLTGSLYSVGHAFHSYSNDVMAIDCDEEHFRLMFGTIELTLLQHTKSYNYFLECVIPKGANYYYNEEGCYVSDQIRIENSYTYEEFVNKFQT